jgi:hypothetical protein
MRFLLGAIFGVLLLVVVVFIADSLATSESAAGAAPRQIVNWALQCHLRFAGRIEAGLKLTAGLLALEPYVVPTPTPPPKPDFHWVTDRQRLHAATIKSRYARHTHVRTVRT